MPAGRPRGHLLDPSLPSSAQRFDSSVDGRKRMRVPIEASRGFPWLDTTEGAIEVLGYFGRPGIVTLRPWDPEGMAVVRRHREIESLAADDASAYDAVAALFLTYGRLSLGSDGLITLSDEALLHLRLHPSDNGRVLVMRSPHGVEIWSYFGRDQAAAQPHQLLADLPPHRVSS